MSPALHDVQTKIAGAAPEPVQLPLTALYLRSRRRIYLALALFSLLVVSLTSYSLWRSYNLEHERAEHFTSEIVRALSGSLAAEFRQIDLALLTIADEASREIKSGQSNPSLLEDMMKLQNSRLRALGGLILIDANGDITLANFTGTANRANVSDRTYFQQLRDNPDAGLVISDPIKGRMTNNWVIVFARRVNGPGSEFAGNVQGFIGLDWFDQYFSGINVGPNGSVSIRDANLGVIIHHPDNETRYTQFGNRAISNEFKMAYAQNREAGTYETPASIDGTRRIVSYTRVPEFPFYVFVGVSKDRLMRRWYQEAIAFSAIASAFIIALIGLSILTIRAWENQSLAARQEAAAKAASDAKSSFLAHMSHELRTPLNVISNYSLLLKEELTDTGQNELVDIVGRIDSARGHLLALISNILDLSKIEADRIDIDIQHVTLDELIEAAVNAAQAISQTNINRFSIEFGPELAGLVLITDATRVKQCLLNLISNAMKFTKNGEVKLTVTRKADDIVFAVSDNGIGMTDEQTARLFQPFAQADRTTTRFFGGTGLGLYLTKSFVTILGGTLSVDSAPGQGSTFTMTLPIKAKV